MKAAHTERVLGRVRKIFDADNGVKNGVKVLKSNFKQLLSQKHVNVFSSLFSLHLFPSDCKVTAHQRLYNGHNRDLFFLGWKTASCYR